MTSTVAEMAATNMQCGTPEQARGRGHLQSQASVTSMSGGGGCNSAERPLKIGVLGTKGVGKTGVCSIKGCILSCDIILSIKIIVEMSVNCLYCTVIILHSAMVVRFLTGRFIWEYSAEERLYVHHCYIGDDFDDDVLLEILDTEAKVRSAPTLIGRLRLPSTDPISLDVQCND